MAKKQRPGVATSQAAQAARQKLADGLYEDVVAAPPGTDLQALIAGVKKAQQARTGQAARLSKKQLQQQKATLDKEYADAKRKEALADAAAQVDVEIDAENKSLIEKQKKDLSTKKKDKDKKKKKLDSISAFNAKLKSLEDAIDRHNANLDGVSSPDVDKLKNAFADTYRAWQQSKSKVNDPDYDKLVQAEKGNTIGLMMVEFKKSIDFLDRVAKRNDVKIQRIKDLRQKQGLTADGKNVKLVEYGDLYKSKLSSFLDMGRGKDGKVSLSRALATAASMVGRDLSNQVGKLKPSNLLTQGTNWALAKAGNNRGAVSAILRVDKSLRVVGTAVKDLGSNTIEWFQKSMGSMLGYLKHKWAQLASGSSGAGGLGKLIGYAALFSALIKPMLAGINTELERRFGTHYVQDFLSSMWDKAKGWMIDGLRSFIFGDPTSNEKPASKGSNLGVQQDLRKDLHPTVGTSADFFAKDWAKGKKPETIERLLGTTLKAYKAQSGDQKEIDRKYLQYYLDGGNGIDMKQLTKPLYDDLKSSGFNVSRFTPWVNNAGGKTSAPVPGSAKVNGALVSNVAGAPQFSAPQRVVSQPTAPPPTGGMDSAPTKAKNPSGVGLGNAQTPNQGVSDRLGALMGGLLI